MAKSKGPTGPAPPPPAAQPASNPKPPKDTEVLHTATLRHSPWTYFHLQLFSPSVSNPEHDILTAKLRITAALKRFLGVLGSSVTVDILQLHGKSLWIRVPRDAGNAVHEAISSWSEGETVKYVVKGRDDWLVKVLENGPEELF